MTANLAEDRIVSRFLIAVALVFIGLSDAQAADLRLLQTNPVSGPNYSLLDLANNEAFSLAEMGQAYGSVRTGVDPDYSSPELWTSDRGIYIGEGGGSYQSRFLRATWESLPVSRVIEISGVIEKGDTEKLKALVEASGFSECITAGLCPYNNTISLNSPGGNLVEALKLGEFIAEQNFNTLLAEGAVCESACALVFLGGYTNYEGFFFPRRYVHETATLGIHRPYFRLPDRTFSSEEVGNVVDIVNEGVSHATSYLLKVGIGLGLLERMYDTPGTDMYRLSPLELSANQIFVLGTKRTVAELSRREVFAYCSRIHLSEFSEPSPELLANLQTSGSAFITFVAGQDFVCAGAKQIKRDAWRAHICVDPHCSMGKFGQVDFYASGGESQPEMVQEIAVSLDVHLLGAAFREYRHRSALLKFVRFFAETWDFLVFPEISPVALKGGVPEEYCGEIDGYDPALVLVVQDLLNKSGIDVGRPDGAAGPNTRRGIRSFNKTRLGRDSETIDEELLLAMGVSPQVVEPFRLCP